MLEGSPIPISVDLLGFTVKQEREPKIETKFMRLGKEINLCMFSAYSKMSSLRRMAWPGDTIAKAKRRGDRGNTCLVLLSNRGES